MLYSSFSALHFQMFNLNIDQIRRIDKYFHKFIPKIEYDHYTNMILYVAQFLKILPQFFTRINTRADLSRVCKRAFEQNSKYENEWLSQHFPEMTGAENPPPQTLGGSLCWHFTGMLTFHWHVDMLICWYVGISPARWHFTGMLIWWYVDMLICYNPAG